MKVHELAAIVGGRVVGDGEAQIVRIAELEQARKGEIAYLDNDKFLPAALESRASCLIVPKSEQFQNRTLIEVKNPKLAFAQIGAVLHPTDRQPSIHATAVV